MALLTHTEVLEIAPRMQPLEQAEPVLSAWRVEGRAIAFEPRRTRLRGVVRNARDWYGARFRCSRPQKNQVVVLSYANTPATLGSLLPIMSELRRMERPVLFISTRSTRSVLRHGLHRGSADLRFLVAGLSPLERRHAREQAMQLAGSVESAIGFRSGRATEWIEAGLLAKAAAVKWLDGAGVVVADCDVEAERRGFFIGARQAGIPTVVVQHGLINELQFPAHASKVFCWGEYFRSQAEQLGARREQLDVVGCTRWDDLVSLRSLPRDPGVRKLLGGRQDKPLVLLISTSHAASLYPTLHGQHFEGVRRLVDAGIDVAVKLHPNENGLSEYGKALPQAIVDRLTVVPSSVGLHTALRHVDVVYHVHSAASLEAMFLGVPVLFEGSVRTLGFASFPDLGGGMWADASTVVKNCASLAANGSERREMLARQDAFLDTACANRGRAAETAALRLLALAEKGRNDV